MPHPKRRLIKRKDEKQRKLGLVVIEVARASNEGRIPITQKNLRELIKRRYDIDIAPPTLSTYIRELEGTEVGNKQWLRTDGHKIYLANPDATLTDSSVIKALHLAHQLRDDSSILININAWTRQCTKQLPHLDSDLCQSFLSVYHRCGYLLKPPTANSNAVELDLVAYNQHMFFLKEAVTANLNRFRPIV